MSHGNVLEGIKCFLNQQSSDVLEIVFDVLEIETYAGGRLLNKTVKKEGNLRIRAIESDCLAKMEVLDNLVFSFSLKFPFPERQDIYKSSKLSIPRPLANGSLKIDHETLELQFTIDAPENELKVVVKHVYRNFEKLNKVSS